MSTKDFSDFVGNFGYRIYPCPWLDGLLVSVLNISFAKDLLQDCHLRSSSLSIIATFVLVSKRCPPFVVYVVVPDALSMALLRAFDISLHSYISTWLLTS